MTSTTRTPTVSVPASQYKEKFHDTRWLEKKLAILKRDGERCAHCGAKNRHLTVRHIIHNGREPWDYPDECYQVFCDSCVQIRQPAMDKLVNELRLAMKNVPNEDLSCVSALILQHAKQLT